MGLAVYLSEESTTFQVDCLMSVKLQLKRKPRLFIHSSLPFLFSLPSFFFHKPTQRTKGLLSSFYLAA